MVSRRLNRASARLESRCGADGRVGREALRTVAALVAPALQRGGIGGGAHQVGVAGALRPRPSSARSRSATVADALRSPASAAARRRISSISAEVRGALALGVRGRDRGDGHGRLLAHLAGADAELLHQFGCGPDARHGVQQVLEPHLGCAVKLGGVVGAVAAGLDVLVDLDRLLRGATRMRPAAVGAVVVDAGLAAGPRAARPQIEVHTFVGHALALPTLSPSALSQQARMHDSGTGGSTPQAVHALSCQLKPANPWLSRISVGGPARERRI